MKKFFVWKDILMIMVGITTEIFLKYKIDRYIFILGRSQRTVCMVVAVPGG